MKPLGNNGQHVERRSRVGDGMSGYARAVLPTRSSESREQTIDSLDMKGMRTSLPPVFPKQTSKAKTLRFCRWLSSGTRYAVGEVDTIYIKEHDLHHAIKGEMVSLSLMSENDRDIYIVDRENGDQGLRTHAQVTTALAKIHSAVVDVFAVYRPRAGPAPFTPIQETPLQNTQKRYRSPSGEEQFRPSKSVKASRPDLIVISDDDDNGVEPGPIHLHGTATTNKDCGSRIERQFEDRAVDQRDRQSAYATGVRAGKGISGVDPRQHQNIRSARAGKGISGVDPSQHQNIRPGSSTDRSVSLRGGDTILAAIDMPASKSAQAPRADGRDHLMTPECASHHAHSPAPNQATERGGVEEEENNEQQCFDDQVDRALDDTMPYGDTEADLCRSWIAAQNRVHRVNIETGSPLQSKDNGTPSLDQITRAEMLFVSLPPNSLRGTEKVSLPGWGLNPGFKAYPHQLLSLSIGFFKQEWHDTRGGILADDHGLGKKVEQLLRIVFRIHYTANATEVKHWWVGHEASHTEERNRHLSSEETSEDLLCPSRFDRPFACYCQPNMRRVVWGTCFRGPYLVITPEYRLKGFDQDIADMLDGSELAQKHRVRVSILPGNSAGSTTYLHGPIGKADVPQYCGSLDMSVPIAFMEKNKYYSVQGNEEAGRVEREWTVSHDNPAFDNATPTPPAQRPFLILVTTPQSFQAELTRLFRVEVSCVGSPDPKELLLTRWAVGFGYLLVDECHVGLGGHRQREMRRIAEASCRDASPYLSPTIWGASGALHRTPGGAVKWCIHMLKTDEWMQDPVLGQLPDQERYDEIRDILHGNGFNANSVRGVLYQQLYTKWCEVVAEHVQLRRSYKTMWYNKQPLSTIQCHVEETTIPAEPEHSELNRIQYITTVTTSMIAERHRRRVAEWEQQGCEPGKLPQPLQSKHHKYALVAAMASIPQFGYHFATNMVNWKDENIHFHKGTPCLSALLAPGQRTEMMSLALKVGLPDGAKFKALLSLLRKINLSTRADGSKEKVIIASAWSITAAWIRVCVESWFAGGSVVYESELMHERLSGQKLSYRVACEEAFLYDPEIWIMIAPIPLVGSSRVLGRASSLILFEPLTSRASIDHLLSQVRGPGQQAPVVRCYTLYNTKSTPDIMAFGESRDRGRNVGV